MKYKPYHELLEEVEVLRKETTISKALIREFFTKECVQCKQLQEELDKANNEIKRINLLWDKDLVALDNLHEAIARLSR